MRPSLPPLDFVRWRYAASFEFATADVAGFYLVALHGSQLCPRVGLLDTLRPTAAILLFGTRSPSRLYYRCFRR